MSTECTLIRGDGVAAYCCAHLLNQADFAVDLQPTNRPRLPVILLGDRALALIRDVFDKPDLFADRPRIRKRVVAWGADAKPVEVDHSAVVVSEEVLLDGIRPTIAKPNEAREYNWTIFATRPIPAGDHAFGTRSAMAVPVRMHDNETCFIESLNDGWLFLVPEGDQRGWMLAVGNTPSTLLAQSHVIARQIVDYGNASGQFPAYARISSPLAGDHWLACGTAAMAFDPICGDGTAHAVREAILAAAVIRALASGGPSDALLNHYQARLTAGFHRHLLLCRQFYQTGGIGALWTTELAAIDRGIKWSASALTGFGEFRYQLRGLELQTI